MNATTGVVRKSLCPFLPVHIKKVGNDWLDADLLFDTGFDGQIALRPTLLDSNCIETEPPLDLVPPDSVLRKGPNLDPKAPFTLHVNWNGFYQEASLHLLHNKAKVPGMLGTRMLRFHVVTIDVIEGGTVSILETPWRPGRHQSSHRRKIQEYTLPPTENEEEYLEWEDNYLPWTNLQVKDKEGYWHLVRVNIDTGDNGELTLPSSWVDKLGLTLPKRSEIDTPQRVESVNKGLARVQWRGREIEIECLQRDEHPPLIGMKLLLGHRIILDFDWPVPRCAIKPLGRMERIKTEVSDVLAKVLPHSPRASGRRR